MRPESKSMVGVYVRVSTVGQNLAGQRAELERWLDGNGVDPARVRWFVDRQTGDNLDRPDFEKLQRAIFAGEIGTVLVWKIDRLSRNLLDGLKVLADWAERGLRIVSVTQQIQFDGAGGRLIAAVLLAIAEMEQETRRERQAAGIAIAKKKGLYRGRVRGTTKDHPDTALQYAERTDEQGNRLLTNREIAKLMSVSKPTVARYLAQAKRERETSKGNN